MKQPGCETVKSNNRVMLYCVKLRMEGGDIAAYRDAGSVDTVRENLEGAKYTIATNAKNAAAGLMHFADIAKFRNELDAKIYGIEPGNDGNRL
jgi:glycine betaine/proline transport system substrate-binding protein